MPSPIADLTQRHNRDRERSRRAHQIVRVPVAIVLAGGLMWASPSAVVPASPSESAASTAAPSSGGNSPAAWIDPVVTPPPAGAIDKLGTFTAGRAAMADAVTIRPPVKIETPALAPAVHTFDMYDRRAQRYQNPQDDACTATATLSMLNTISYSGASADFVWKPSTTLLEQEYILIYERSHMTAPLSQDGSDPHGWRNALNYYGWGSIKAGVYADESFSTFDDAAKSAVSALATKRKPVGILGTSGGHAQFITGYTVAGDDPAHGSMNFQVLGVFLTDPWRGASHRNYWVTYSRWQSGTYWVQFSPFLMTDSHTKDPIDGKYGVDEWYGKWVIVAPVK